MAATNSTNSNSDTITTPNSQLLPPPLPPSRYESQKRRDWRSFGQYLKNHRPPLTLSRCSGAHVLEFLRYLDQFGKTKVHLTGCSFFGHPRPPAPCPCPLRQAWGSLDALVGRLRAAFEENGGQPEVNPFGARAVRLYLREIRDSQAKARGIAYEKKKRKQHQTPTPPPLQTDPPTISTTTIDLGIVGTDSLRLLPVGFELNLLDGGDIGVEGLNDEVNVGNYQYYDLLHGNLFGEVRTTTTTAATAAGGVNGVTVADGQSSFSGAYNLLIR